MLKKNTNKNKIKEILYTRQYSPKKIKPKKGKGSFKRANEHEQRKDI